MNRFLVGAATAAHQVEGRNTYSDYWIMEHVRHSDFSEPSGDACDHYHRYEEDILLLKKAGGNAYRFGIEWARVEPEEGCFDQAEIEHYRRVITFCLQNGITPLVTLMHFSSPAWLIRRGGWANENVVRYFERYADRVAHEYGEKLPYICTINEANMGQQLNKVVADMMKAGRRKDGGVQVGQNNKLSLGTLLLGMIEQGRAFHVSPFQVNSFLKPRKEAQEKIIMQAHRAAVSAIKKESPLTRVGLSLSLFDYQPEEGGKEKAETLWQEDFGWYLPYIAQDDFLGVQNYSRKIVDYNGAREPADHAPLTQMGYEDYPGSVGNVLRKVAAGFQGELLVTENGIATEKDQRRCEFIREAFASVMGARQEGVPVTAYFYWSLLDNFEWQAGYSKTFGLVAVDRRTQERHPKESLWLLDELVRKSEENKK